MQSNTINQIKSKGIEEVGARHFANILHAIAKLRLSNRAYSLGLIAELESKGKVRVLFEANHVQNVSNCVWSCAKLGIQSPNLFRMLESRADWIFENGKPQEISNCVWSCATLGIQSPNLFRITRFKSRMVICRMGNCQDYVELCLELCKAWDSVTKFVSIC